MTPAHIEAAELEAKRFLDRCQAAKDAFEWWSLAKSYRNNDTKATAALKRASMDLSRALSELRK